MPYTQSIFSMEILNVKIIFVPLRYNLFSDDFKALIGDGDSGEVGERNAHDGRRPLESHILRFG